MNTGMVAIHYPHITHREDFSRASGGSPKYSYRHPDAFPPTTG